MYNPEALMNTNHFSVPLLDVGELLPFEVKKKKTLEQDFAEQERARHELIKFINLLERKMRQEMHYLGMDVIGEKSYERFLFEKGGFFEAMTEAPVALNAHFTKQAQAKIFLKALKETLEKILPNGPVGQLLIESIEIQTQDDTSLTVQKWNKMKDLM